MKDREEGRRKEMMIGQVKDGIEIPVKAGKSLSLPPNLRGNVSNHH